MHALLLLVCLLCLAGLRHAAPTSYLPTGRMWHITDLHLDPTYHVTSDPTKVCFSSKGAPAVRAGLFGDFLCDSPYRLITSAFETMATLTRQHDFIIWTGDSPPHVPKEELSTDMVIDVMENMTHTITKHFPNITVYPSLGNHDYWPQDQMPDSTNAVYKAAAQMWSGWLQDDALLTLSQGGFYSQLVRPGLRVVSLNTILYYGPDRATLNSSDPAGQFEWLEDTLVKAARSKEKVYIIGHVPIGFLPFARNVTAMRAVHSERLVEICREHSDVIAGHFYGHTHRDSIMVLLDTQGNPVNSLFVSPAVTPIKSVLEPYSNNPAFRMYLYDNRDYAVLDIWQYYLNLTEANVLQRSDWKLEYSMKSSFGLPDLRPHSLLKLAISFMLPQAQTFARYFTHFVVSYDRSLTCSGECKVSQVCSVIYLDHSNYTRCVTERGALWEGRL